MRVIKPLGVTSSLPVSFSLHGGSFIAGHNDGEEMINRQLAIESKIAIFSFEYRLAPEHDVVTTIYEDVEDGARWVVEHASEYQGDLTGGIYAGGTFVGAHLAALVAFRAEKLGFKVKGLLLRQGAYIFGPSKEEWKPRLKSLEETADSPLLGADEVRQLIEIMNIPPEKAQDPWYFPIFGSREELTRFPRTYFVRAGCDPVIDDIKLFKDLLDEAGVETRLKIYEVSLRSPRNVILKLELIIFGPKGMPHGFHGFHGFTRALQEMKDTTGASHGSLALTVPEYQFRLDLETCKYCWLAISH
jgi:acetyl esterase